MILTTTVIFHICEQVKTGNLFLSYSLKYGSQTFKGANTKGVSKLQHVPDFIVHIGKKYEASLKEGKIK